MSLQSKGLSRVFSTSQFKSINSLALSPLYTPTLTSIHDHWKKHSFSYPYMTTGKSISFPRRIFASKVTSLLFNMLFRLVITFLLASLKEQASFNFRATVNICSDFGAPKIKAVTVSTFSPSICHDVMGPDAMILVFWMLSFKPTFSLSSVTFIKKLFSLLHFLP